VVVSGAGVSAESGIKTFRDSDGLWEGYDVMEVATPEGFRKNPSLVLEFYNKRRAQLFEVEPNRAHIDIASLENDYEVHVITQNVDDLHERAGSTQVIHLHGELRKVRSTKNPELILDWEGNLIMGQKGEDGQQLRPHIVWFGEQVPLMEIAYQIISDANIVLVVGSSMQVYPAAGLIDYAPRDAKIFYVDPNPNINHELSLRKDLEIIQEKASTGIAKVVQKIKQAT
jgi:NAD-dependent deacetylase